MVDITLGELSLDKEEPTENLITWIFDEGSFVPSTKITKDDTFSIVSDYIGKPIAAYNGVGNLVWNVEYDIYGNIRSQSKGDKDFIPFRNQGQYEDAELNGLMYNRFRYYDGNSGTYISQDPIRLEGNNPTFYAYPHDSNSTVDIFGLDFFYQLIKDGKVVYNGITKNPIEGRIGDHIRDIEKDFTEFRYLEVDDRVASRNLEGSALHNANGKGLQNAIRLDGQYWHSYYPSNLKPGRTYYTQAEIEAKMKNAKPSKIENKKVILNHH